MSEEVSVEVSVTIETKIDPEKETINIDVR